jgi:hypothetical protein
VQVLLLDSDNLPTQDPAVLFSTPAFTNHGFLTWPDFWHNLWMEPAVYRLLNLTVPWEADPQGLAAESGQLLVDRARHADVLEWLWLLNAHKGLVYQCLVGDKDTYRLAFELAGKGRDYQQVCDWVEKVDPCGCVTLCCICWCFGGARRLYACV